MYSYWCLLSILLSLISNFLILLLLLLLLFSGSFISSKNVVMRLIGIWFLLLLNWFILFSKDITSLLWMLLSWLGFWCFISTKNITLNLSVDFHWSMNWIHNIIFITSKLYGWISTRSLSYLKENIQFPSYFMKTSTLIDGF